MHKIIKVGSRESALAIRQAELIIDLIQKNNTHIVCELITMKTKGDKILDQNLDKIGGKGLFITELEQALRNMEIDIAVHSYKDMPYEQAKDLPIVALSQRSSPFDVLVLPLKTKVGFIDPAKPVGSSSLRRNIQFKAVYKDFETSSIRGNVITRLKKLDQGDYSGLILAEAGLIRLGLVHRVSKVFTLEEMIPSASQGILAVQARKGEDHSYLSCCHSKISEYVSLGERQFLKTLNAGCNTATGVYGSIHNNELRLVGMIVDKQQRIIKDWVHGNLEQAAILGEMLGKTLQHRGMLDG